MMKTKHIIYPLVLVIAFIVPVMRYYASTPDVNSCVLEYVENLEQSNNKGYIYNIDGVRHIEPANSNNIKSLEKYLVGKSEGCMMYSDDLWSDFNNTIYCAVTYMIKKSPIINQRAKEPLALLRRY